MPGFDGTGPRGQGPLTGGGFGPCRGENPLPGPGRGGPRGRSFGGRGYRGRFAAAFAPAPATPEQEDDALRRRLELLEREAEAIRSRLADTGGAK